ncbi:unnamed protein product [Chondrus crispus]|uniref:Uncharacterized protein n=1 Tax=Chondrus crispus TaxID=2769 RepID=R7Q9M7_CHOCR|nr:unnamed protein product [Chondrus crispus]CDF34081.1 unnamed protein product [Chondrus crispus]|eukprot:XP_005713900.1 unnamed protein product [Chondrus crispus]
MQSSKTATGLRSFRTRHPCPLKQNRSWCFALLPFTSHRILFKIFPLVGVKFTAPGIVLGSSVSTQTFPLENPRLKTSKSYIDARLDWLRSL